MPPVSEFLGHDVQDDLVGRQHPRAAELTDVSYRVTDVSGDDTVIGGDSHTLVRQSCRLNCRIGGRRKLERASSLRPVADDAGEVGDDVRYRTGTTVDVSSHETGNARSSS